MLATSSINQRALRGLQLSYFARFGAYGFVLLYLNLFFKQQGLSGTQIGALGTIWAVSSLLAAPVWGRLSDRFGKSRQLLQAALVASALGEFLLGRQTVFGWLAIFTAFNGIWQAPLEPLADSITISLTQGKGYGSVRSWGSLGWAILVVVAGWLIDHFGLPVMFIGYVVFIVMAAILLMLVPVDGEPVRREQKLPFRETLSGLFANRSMLWLLIALALQLMTQVGTLAFEPIYLNDLGAGGALIGVGFTVASFVEAPAMLWADRHLRMRSGGGLLRLGLLLGVIRAATVVLFPTVPVIVGGRVIDGLGYAFRQVSTIVLITRNTSPGQTTTVLALYTATLYSTMQIVSAPLAGLVYDNLGAYWLYIFSIVLQLAAIVILWLAFPPRTEMVSVGDVST